MGFFKRFFSSKKKELSSGIDDIDFDLSEDELIKKFSKLSSADRMGAIIKYGDVGDFKYYPLLRYSIQHDPDIHVKFAVLKRIHLFQGHPEVITMLNELNDCIDTKSLEPYYSMALSKLGIISIEEFKNRMNKS